ncbi:MAG: response regulator [Methanosarcinaceae archaeon]|nr:response regulator [Methanosarcinaceae archaeon]
MSEDQTHEIMASLRGSLANKNALLLTPLNVFSERFTYFYIYSVLKNETEKNIVWMCLKRSRNDVLGTFSEYGFDIEEFSDRIWFIDVGSGQEPTKNTFYCSSPTDYIKIGTHTSKLFGQHPDSILVIDGIGIISQDNSQVVENFISVLVKTVRESKGSMISMLEKGVVPSDREGVMRSFFDVIVDITESGEMHTEIGLKSMDVQYKIKKGQIHLTYIPKKVMRKRLKILVVDDEPDIPELIKLSLASGPYDFIEAYGGQEAVDTALEELPDLILLDIMMPDMDGYDVVEKLKRDKDGRNIAIIMVSAKTKVDDKIKGMELGIDDYISKPFDKREVDARIKMVMKRFGWKPPEETNGE